MARHAVNRRQSTGILSLVPLFSLSVAAACSQDPAFIEKAQNVTSDDVASAGRGTEGDHQTNKDGRKRGSPDGDGLKNGKESVEDEGGSLSPGSIVAEVGAEVGAPRIGVPLPDEKLAAAHDNGKVQTPGAGEAKKTEDDSGDGKRNGGAEKVTPEPKAGDTPGSSQPVVEKTPTPESKPVQPVAKAGAQVVFETQQKAAKVDILWVVDDSGSMSWAQNQLGKNFESFAKELQTAKLDFQVGVTSTDVCDIDWKSGDPKPDELCPDADMIASGQNINGKMVGPMRGEFIIDSKTKQKILKPGVGFVESFKRVSNLGTGGSAMEHGLSAAKLAVQKSLSGVNSGFLRSDAFLSVIVLSDEEDDGIQMWCEDAWGRTSLNAAGKKDLNACKEGGNSPFLDVFQKKPYALMKKDGSWMTQHKFTADNFVSYMNDPAVKGSGKFRLSAITGVRGTDGKIVCDSPHVSVGEGPQESGTSYIKAANSTGGIVENICAPDWSQLLGNIGQNISELANKVALPKDKVPFPGTLEVTVNGQVWDASKYQYEAQGNFLSFKVIPPSSADIRIVYKETSY